MMAYGRYQGPLTSCDEVRDWWQDRDEGCHGADYRGEPLNEDQTGAPEWWAREMRFAGQAAATIMALSLADSRGKWEEVRRRWPDVPEEDLRRMAQALNSTRSAGLGRTKLTNQWLPGAHEQVRKPARPAPKSPFDWDLLAQMFEEDYGRAARPSYRPSESVLNIANRWRSDVEREHGPLAAYIETLRDIAPRVRRYARDEYPALLEALAAAERRLEVEKGE